MKPTQVIEIFATIKATFVSFFSILMFVALGVGVFLGISWVSSALENGADNYFNEGQFHDFQIQFPYGLTDDDVKELGRVEGVTQIEAGHQSIQAALKDGQKNTVKVHSLGQDIDTPIVREGTLPSKPNEMAFHAESAERLSVSVGDTVTFEHDANAQGDDLSLGLDDESANADSAVKQADVSDGMRYLKGDTFTVTAIVDSADYASVETYTYGFSNSPSGSVDALAWVPDAAFDPAAFKDGYPIVNVRSESLPKGATYSDEYAQKSKEVGRRISELGKELAVARYDGLHDNAQAQLDEAQKKLDDAKAQIADGERQIEEGEAKLVQGRAELDAAVAAGEAELASAYDLLITGESVKAEAEAELASALAKIEQAQAAIDELDSYVDAARSTAHEMKAYKAEQDKELESGKISEKKYNENLDKYGAQVIGSALPFLGRAGKSLNLVDHTNFDEAIDILQDAIDLVDEVPIEVEGEVMTVGEARERLAEYEELADEGQAELDEKSAELEAGWSQYYSGQNELQTRKAQGEQEIAKGEAELENARAQVEDGKAQVAEKEPKLEEAKQKVAELKKYDWTVLSRSHSAGAAEVTTFSNVTGNLSISMAALFIIVGLLVSYFAVSRIVRDQVAQIGAKKALGFRRGEITRSFLLYSGFAVLFGSIAGAIVGYFLVEGIIDGALAEMFAFGAFPAYFGWGLFIAVTLIELALILLATYLACRGILKQHAVELLRGGKPPESKTRFYEKWGIWNSLPLLMQTIVNNCIKDKRRMLSTIVGVAGCTALIVTAITLNNDVLKSYDRHYEETYGFSAIAYVDAAVDGADGKVESALRSQGATTARVSMKSYAIEQPDDNVGVIRIVVPRDEDAFNQLYHVNPTTGGTFDLYGEGAWVSQAYGNHLGVEVGDSIIVDGGDGTKHEVPVLGYYDFWLTYNEMVVGADYFQKEFGDSATNALLVNTGGVSLDDLRNSAETVEGFDSIIDDAANRHVNFETFAGVSSAVVAIYLVLAALMAVVVLLNLNVMFIEEKKRELIVLMINGFSVKDAKHYISYDSIVLTTLGIIAGIVLGCLMGSITVMAMEPVTATFVKSPDAWAIIIGIAGSALLAIIMSKIALRRIPRFSLTDINKV